MEFRGWLHVQNFNSRQLPSGKDVLELFRRSRSFLTAPEVYVGIIPSSVSRQHDFFDAALPYPASLKALPCRV